MAKIYLIPNLLGSEDSLHVIPEGVRETVEPLRLFAVENLRESRRYLRKLHRDFDIDGSEFHILNKRTPIDEIEIILNEVKKGKDCGILSDAGCPGVADPGSKLVQLAHDHGIDVVPLTGPSSILLALMGSGMNGQQFKFHGYLPKDRKDRIAAIRHMNAQVARNGETQIFMETPFRNEHMYEDVVANSNPTVRFCIASNLTTPREIIKTRTIENWRTSKKPSLHKLPCMFLLGR